MDTSSDDDAHATIHDPRFQDDRLDHLVLLALGRTVPATFTAHQSGCAECQQDLIALSRTVALGREAVANPADLAAQPPAAVWAAIAAEAGLDAAASDSAPSDSAPSDSAPSDWAGLDPAGLDSAGLDSTGLDSAASDSAGSDSAGPDPAGPDQARPRSHRARSRRAPRTGVGTHRSLLPLRSRYGLAAAAVVLAVAGVAGGYVAGRTAGSHPTHPAANAQLATVRGGPTTAVGAAAVRVSGDDRQLTVTTTGLARRGGFYEVWLFDPDRGSSGDMVAVGALGDRGRGTFTLPAGIDLRDYHVVDVSAQDYGGGAAIVHAQSVLQGSLSQ